MVATPSFGRIFFMGVATSFLFVFPSHGAGDTTTAWLPNLKLADASRQVASIRYCGDAYRVVAADGRTHQWREFDLRFKTDGSPDGPSAGKPVIVGTGMKGDRAAIVFSRPDEISAFIRKECP